MNLSSVDLLVNIPRTLLMCGPCLLTFTNRVPLILEPYLPCAMIDVPESRLHLNSMNHCISKYTYSHSLTHPHTHSPTLTLIHSLTHPPTYLPHTNSINIASYFKNYFITVLWFHIILLLWHWRLVHTTLLYRD